MASSACAVVGGVDFEGFHENEPAGAALAQDGGQGARSATDAAAGGGGSSGGGASSSGGSAGGSTGGATVDAAVTETSTVPPGDAACVATGSRKSCTSCCSYRHPD